MPPPASPPSRARTHRPRCGASRRAPCGWRCHDPGPLDIHHRNPHCSRARPRAAVGAAPRRGASPGADGGTLTISNGAPPARHRLGERSGMISEAEHRGDRSASTRPGWRPIAAQGGVTPRRVVEVARERQRVEVVKVIGAGSSTSRASIRCGLPASSVHAGLDREPGPRVAVAAETMRSRPTPRHGSA